ncbi:hypothetical protein KUH32_13925 [Thalassococcus sp. CAU 1522]|uniref:Uncharacterized protein n=1 Tax=Thalassococcus arenae TaxID=2851652 RepID=A0ABS6NA09_9RHOB|nr:hypothetical protein [Thalassococcus arenae]MBV2360861.1 hypothetical protein [Thalassococcus arenae]
MSTLRRKAMPVLAAIAALAQPTVAAPLLADGGYGIWLEDGQGARIRIGALEVGAGAYRLSMNDAPFTDQFLSMRPFKCLEGPDKMWCHVPYPYPNRHDLNAGPTDLEYDLLFVWKGKGDYGIDMWNGLYYALARDGSGLTGAVHEMNMDMLAVPPVAGDLRPIAPGDLHQADPDSHWLPVLRVLPD